MASTAIALCRARHARGTRSLPAPTGRSLTSLRDLLVICGSIGGAGLLLAACSSARVATPAAPGTAPKAASGPAFGLEPARGAAGTAGSGATDLAKLAPSQSIVYTANLALRVKDVSGAAAQASGDVTAVGGYVADEQQTRRAGRGGAAGIDRISLQVKIPVAEYRAVLTKLSGLGRQLSFSEQATDVTQQVADVSSRAASAEAAIRQLRELLGRAGNVGQLLSVQDQINSEESALEALLAQQRALAHETTYATVSVALLGHRVIFVTKADKVHHGLTAGLLIGWRALKAVVTWLLTALGTVLPFAVPVAFICGIAVWGRRRLARRRTPPAAA
ncbi:MAG TPA: DUF4349 domain-containing protein [Streptosporangiaceae bacterium]|nr:DUF4349 domain-containing protein [Streptosporangiaceae bacterium]